MALLTDEQRRVVHAELTRRFSDRRDALPSILKQDVRDAVNSTDQWIEDNKVSFNNSLPTPIKNNFTAKMKAELFFLVAMEKFSTQ